MKKMEDIVQYSSLKGNGQVIWRQQSTKLALMSTMWDPHVENKPKHTHNKRARASKHTSPLQRTRCSQIS